jgi:hypothetical protein
VKYRIEFETIDPNACPLISANCPKAIKGVEYSKVKKIMDRYGVYKVPLFALWSSCHYCGKVYDKYGMVNRFYTNRTEF